MEYKDIKDLAVDELKKKKQALTQDLFNAKMKNSLGQLANPMEIRHARKNIAKINTALAKKVVR